MKPDGIGWWLVQLAIPLLIFTALLAIEIGWWMGYFPIER